MPSEGFMTKPEGSEEWLWKDLFKTDSVLSKLALEAKPDDKRVLKAIPRDSIFLFCIA